MQAEKLFPSIERTYFLIQNGFWLKEKFSLKISPHFIVCLLNIITSTAFHNTIQQHVSGRRSWDPCEVKISLHQRIKVFWFYTGQADTDKVI